MSALLNPFEAGPAAALALFATRVGGAVMIAPVFSARTVPVPVRVAVLVVLTAATAPMVLGHGEAPSVGAVTLASELLIGFGVGLGAALIVGAAQIAGDVLAFQMGLSGASTLDPMSHQQTTALSDFFMLLVVLIVLTMDGHVLILEALTDSVSVVPLGSGIEASAGMLALAGLGTNLFITGVRIAAPVMAAVFIGNVAMGVLARTAPQLQLFMLAYPLQIMLGTAVLALSLPLIGVSFTGWAGEYRGFVLELLDTFGGR